MRQCLPKFIDIKIFRNLLRTIMRCSSMKLVDRMQQQLFVTKTEDARKCHPILRDNFESDLPRTPSRNAEELRFLSVLNINLPQTLQAFNTGSCTKRWASKRPRLKSAKKNTKIIDPDDTVLIKDEEVTLTPEETTTEDINNNNLLNNEIDVNVQRLIAEAEEYAKRNAGISEEIKSKRKRRKKSREIKENSKSVSFCISKPASPATEQIIRVDVVSSNYMISDESVADKPRNDEESETPKLVQDEAPYHSKQFVDSAVLGELRVTSKKVVLFNRHETSIG